MIAQGAEAKVYFKSNDTSVIKIRALQLSILPKYAKLSNGKVNLYAILSSRKDNLAIFL